MLRRTRYCSFGRRNGRSIDDVGESSFESAEGLRGGVAAVASASQVVAGYRVVVGLCDSPDQVDAEPNNGALTVRLGKSAKSQPRQISIRGF
jgi:hypothetical protein